MLVKEPLRKIRTMGIVNTAIAGQYHSTLKVRGMESEEVRAYQIGGDVHTIDWNTSARYGEPFVRVYREEPELNAMLLPDLGR